MSAMACFHQLRCRRNISHVIFDWMEIEWISMMIL